MNILYAILLGAIQGFTEWLPISSSGHLVIIQTLLNLQIPAEFDIVIMLGTTLALIIYFRKKIFEIISGFFKWEKDSINYVLYIIIAGILTAIIGFSFKAFFKNVFSAPIIVCILLIINGIFLFIAINHKKHDQKINPKNAAIIGIAQSVAILPGISRSGSTIGTGMLCGLKPKDAAEFSFLLGIPTMIGASVIELGSAINIGIGTNILLAGIISSFITGYLGIKLFMHLLEKGKLKIFAYYCIIAGLFFTILLLI